jgi:hypothetical protein
MSAEQKPSERARRISSEWIEALRDERQPTNKEGTRPDSEANTQVDARIDVLAPDAHKEPALVTDTSPSPPSFEESKTSPDHRLPVFQEGPFQEPVYSEAENRAVIAARPRPLSQPPPPRKAARSSAPPLPEPRRQTQPPPTPVQPEARQPVLIEPRPQLPRSAQAVLRSLGGSSPPPIQGMPAVHAAPPATIPTMAAQAMPAPATHSGAADAAVASLLAESGAQFDIAQVAAVKAQWKTPHRSAFRWAEVRKGALSGQVRRKPRKLAIMLGLLIVGLSAWSLVSFLPAHRPLSPEARAELATHAGVNLEAWRFPAKAYDGAQLACLGLIVIGLIVVVRGILFAPRRRLLCQVCHHEVVVEVEAFQFACTNGPHRARRRYAPVVLLFAFIWCSMGLLVAVVWGMVAQTGP